MRKEELTLDFCTSQFGNVTTGKPFRSFTKDQKKQTYFSFVVLA
jgi:hypothetical protein